MLGFDFVAAEIGAKLAVYMSCWGILLPERDKLARVC